MNNLPQNIHPNVLRDLIYGRKSSCHRLSVRPLFFLRAICFSSYSERKSPQHSFLQNCLRWEWSGIVFFLVLLLAGTAQADGPRHHAALFSRAAMNRANRVYSSDGRRVLSRSFENGGADFFETDVTSTADAVHEIFQDRQSGAEFFSQYRSPMYLNYLSDVVHVPELEEWREKAAAERIFVYQSVTSISQVLMKSALEPFFRDTLKKIQTFKRFTSVKFQRGDSGGLGVSQKIGKEKPLFELKLHVSANNGIEPRLEVGDHFLLRYDVVHDDTIAEFRTSF